MLDLNFQSKMDSTEEKHKASRVFFSQQQLVVVNEEQILANGVSLC